jgi:hypothetical protein
MVYIDTNNYIKRIYHGGGNPYTLIYNLLEKLKEYKIQFVCDTFNSRAGRRELWPNYKKGRDMGDDPVYFDVLGNCKDMAACYPNVTVIDVINGEADDYIRDIARSGDTVISNDKDLWHLIDYDVKVLLNASTVVSRELIEIKFNCVPKHIHLYKALVGDPSDKIPGKRGFGAKAWAKMCYEDRELYAHHFEIENCDYDPDIMTEQACISWKLADIWPTASYRHAYRDEHVLDLCEKRGIVL